MTLEQSFERALKKGHVTLRSLAMNGITSVEFFKYTGWKGYVAQMAEKTFPAGGRKPIIEIVERDKHEFDIARKDLLKCSIPKIDINKCLHWRECRHGEECEKRSEMPKVQGII